ncbi:MAG TPA: L,D-transpeptidase family protein [Methyloceanibacter sp.]|jgi:lipoprotein-anchoring transpeptidase ErfK/SrfK|nr:L,D-transpeptidase family protein [Methyloceanibacter sp.]
MRLRLLRLHRHASGLIVVPFLALALAFPVGAETSTKAPSAPAGGTPPSAQAKPNPAVSQPKSDAAVAQPKSDASAPPPESGAAAAPDANAAATPDANAAATPDANAAASQAGSQILINIDKSRQEMTVFVDGVEQYTWPVSTGRPGYSTPSGNYTPTSMNEIWYSKQWDNSPMPHSIFFMKDGHAIHGTHEVKNLGKAVSHGCVRISPENAATLYALVETNGMQNTKVALSGETPGGEAKVASQPRYGPGPGWFVPGQQAQEQPYQRPRRRGLFGRWFQPYNGPQGYYGPRGYYPPRGYPPPGY